MLKKSIFLAVILLAMACTENIPNSKTANLVMEEGPLFNEQELQEKLYKAIFKGDTNSYKKASNVYFGNDKNAEFLFYAIRMANKHDYSKAYFDVYLILAKSSTYRVPIDLLDSVTKNMAMYYLMKSYEKGCVNAIYEVKECSKTQRVFNSAYYRKKW